MTNTPLSGEELKAAAPPDLTVTTIIRRVWEAAYDRARFGRESRLGDYDAVASKAAAEILALSTRPAPSGDGSDRENERRVADLLRAAYMRVQADKARKDGPLSMQPIWDVVNLAPEVLYCLDRMAEFERDCAMDEEAAPSGGWTV